MNFSLRKNSPIINLELPSPVLTNPKQIKTKIHENQTDKIPLLEGDVRTFKGGGSQTNTSHNRTRNVLTRAPITDGLTCTSKHPTKDAHPPKTCKQRKMHKRTPNHYILKTSFKNLIRILGEPHHKSYLMWLESPRAYKPPDGIPYFRCGTQVTCLTIGSYRTQNSKREKLSRWMASKT